MAKVHKLKEARAKYKVEIDPARLDQEPIILERGGKSIGAVISITDYHALRKRDAGRRLSKQFLKNEAVFRQLLPELLRTHRGKWVAVYKGKLVGTDEELGDLAQRVYASLGYHAIYMNQVLEQERVYRILSPRVIR